MSQNIKSTHYLPFSQSVLWQKQNEFYQKQGVQAWNDILPFYATSNPNISHGYAMIIIRYLQDLLHEQVLNQNEPIYILELGAGSGKFSYYILRQLKKLLHDFRLNHLKIKYVMSDFAQSNINFWQSHLQLQTYIEEGILDFAFFDAEATTDILLLHSQVQLRQSNIQNPLIILANYVFDSLRHDLFRIHNKQLQIGLLSSELLLTNLPNNELIKLEQFDENITYQAINSSYYQSQVLNGILQDYQAKYDQCYFYFPIGALRCLEHLRVLSNGKLLLLATDKGYGKHVEAFADYTPDITFHSHSAFSLLVNFYAIGKYAEAYEGDVYHQDNYQGLISSAFVFNNSFNKLIETSHAVHQYFNIFSASNLLNLSKYINNSKAVMSFEFIMSYLAVSAWDCEIFSTLLITLTQCLEEGYPLAIEDLIDCLNKVAANFYFMPSCSDIFFEIGVILQNLEQHTQSIEYYMKSLTYFKVSEETLYNMALSYYQINEKNKAIELLQQVIQLNNYHITAKGLLTHIQNIL